MGLLAGFRVAQVGPGLAAAVCGRVLADVGADVLCVGVDEGEGLAGYLNHGKARLGLAEAMDGADLVVVEGGPAALAARGHDAASLRRLNGSAALVVISPYGQTGPDADVPATDLTLMAASGIMRMLTGQVDDLDEAPVRAVGEQSAFIGGLAGACAGMHAALGVTSGAVIDVSIQEALATLAMTELTRAGLTGKSWSRKRVGDGNGATVCILPASDGYAAISPREEKQWAAWLEAMGSPEWGREARFAKKADRVANWDALHALMSDWSRGLTKQAIADLAQEAHVPSFPLREPAEHVASEQLAHRGYWREMDGIGRVPGVPFGLALHAGSGAARKPAGVLPLAGLLVLDFSWVIAGPTTTRTLAAMGAEVIKVEAPGAGDPGRASELHTVLGQGKRAIVLDLKSAEGKAAARSLAARCDVLVENFATGVMDRLGLGAEALREVNPDLVYVSASGLGRTGPEAGAVAYGTLLQCYAGFAGLNRHPDRAPRVGMAWLDPMCGLMLAFITAAALWRRGRDGTVARVDFSMVEAMLWTMAAPLLELAGGGTPRPRGNLSPTMATHGVYRCAGKDSWVALAACDDIGVDRLTELTQNDFRDLYRTVSDIGSGAHQVDAAIAAWARQLPAAEAVAQLRAVGLLAAPVASSGDLVASGHLVARGFWDGHGTGRLPGLPWRASFGRRNGPAPGLGADTVAVLAELGPG